MKLNKIITIIAILLFIFIISFNSNIYAAVCDITINDSSNTTGFAEKNGQLYYVVSVDTENSGGNLSGITLKFQYDTEHLAPLVLNDGESLDLGEKGIFYGAGRLEYDGWNNGGSTGFNQSSMTLSVYKKEGSDLAQIDDKKITLITLCFRVLDNNKEKRAVYIDTFDSNNEILYASLAQKRRYISNGLEDSVIDSLKNAEESTKEITIEYEDGTNDTTENTISQPNEKVEDTTLADRILPNTGVRTMVLIIVVAGLITLVVYKKMNKYKKIIK